MNYFAEAWRELGPKDLSTLLGLVTTERGKVRVFFDPPDEQLALVAAATSAVPAVVQGVDFGDRHLVRDGGASAKDGFLPISVALALAGGNPQAKILCIKAAFGLGIAARIFHPHSVSQDTQAQIHQLTICSRGLNRFGRIYDVAVFNPEKVQAGYQAVQKMREDIVQFLR